MLDFVRGVAHEHRRATVPFHDEVYAQRDVGRAHRPDVQIVNLLYARKSGDVRLDGSGVDVRRHGVEQKVERFAKETNRTHEDAAEGSNFEPSTWAGASEFLRSNFELLGSREGSNLEPSASTLRPRADLLPCCHHEQKVHETEKARRGPRRCHARAEATRAPTLSRRPRATQAAPAEVPPVAPHEVPASWWRLTWPAWRRELPGRPHGERRRLGAVAARSRSPVMMGRAARHHHRAGELCRVQLPARRAERRAEPRHGPRKGATRLAYRSPWLAPQNARISSRVRRVEVRETAHSAAGARC